MKKYKFTAKIEAGDGGGAYVLFPYDTETEFATKGKVPVKATFNGVPYTGSLREKSRRCSKPHISHGRHSPKIIGLPIPSFNHFPTVRRVPFGSHCAG
jgi:hypothetical protein